MGFWEVLGKVVSSALERGAKAHLEMQKKAAAQLKDYEKKIINAEKSGKMSNPEYAKKVYEAKQKLETARVKIYTGKEDVYKRQVQYWPIMDRSRMGVFKISFQPINRQPFSRRYAAMRLLKWLCNSSSFFNPFSFMTFRQWGHFFHSSLGASSPPI